MKFAPMQEYNGSTPVRQVYVDRRGMHGKFNLRIYRSKARQGAHIVCRSALGWASLTTFSYGAIMYWLMRPLSLLCT